MSIFKNNETKENKEIYKQINNWIKEDKIKFSFYNSYIPVEILQLYYDETKGTVEIKIRDTVDDRIQELKGLIHEIENKKNMI